MNKGTEQSEKIEFFIPQRNTTQEFNKDLQGMYTGYVLVYIIYCNIF